MNAPLRPAAHRHAIRVQYADTDAGGVVHHAGYLRFAEAARTEFLRDAGLSHAEMLSKHHRAFVVRKLRIAYLAAARLDSALTVATLPLAVRGASVGLRQDVWDEHGKVLVSMTLDLGCIDAQTFRPARIPAAWATGLAAIVAPTLGSEMMED